MSSQPAYSTETPPMTTAARAAAVMASRAPGRPARKVPPPPPVGPRSPILTDPALEGIEIAIELITPELAEHYLSKRPADTAKIQQRSVSGKTTDRYIGDMVSEQWLFTGDPVRFNRDGELIDGQHRLMAIARSGIAQPMIVIRGLHPETFVVFDTGRPRSFTDVLKSKGVPNVSIVAGLTRRVLYWQRGNYGVPNVARTPNAAFVGVPVSTSLLVDTFEANEAEIQASGRRGNAFKANFATKTAAPAVVGFVHMLLSRLDLERCEKFFHELQFGPSQVGPEYPIAVLRQRLYKRVPEHAAALPDWVWVHFFFTVWNRWLRGETIGNLKIPSEARFNYVALPMDPHADDRPAGWSIFGGVPE